MGDQVTQTGKSASTSRIDVIGQNGNEGLHYHDAEGEPIPVPEYGETLIECEKELATQARTGDLLINQLKDALCDFGDPSAPVAFRMRSLREDREALYENFTQLLEAAGDADHLTYHMLLEQIRQNRRDAEEARNVRQYLSGFSDEQRSLTEIVSSLIDSAIEKNTTQAADRLRQHNEELQATIDRMRANNDRLRRKYGKLQQYNSSIAEENCRLRKALEYANRDPERDAAAIERAANYVAERICSDQSAEDYGLELLCYARQLRKRWKDDEKIITIRYQPKGSMCASCARANDR